MHYITMYGACIVNIVADVGEGGTKELPEDRAHDPARQMNNVCISRVYLSQVYMGYISALSRPLKHYSY